MTKKLKKGEFAAAMRSAGINNKLWLRMAMKMQLCSQALSQLAKKMDVGSKAQLQECLYKSSFVAIGEPGCLPQTERVCMHCMTS